MISELQNEELYITATIGFIQNFTDIAQDQLEDPLKLPKMLPQLSLDVFNADKIQVSLQAMARTLGVSSGADITPMVSCEFESVDCRRGILDRRSKARRKAHVLLSLSLSLSLSLVSLSISQSLLFSFSFSFSLPTPK